MKLILQLYEIVTLWVDQQDQQANWRERLLVSDDKTFSTRRFKGGDVDFYILGCRVPRVEM